MIKRILWTLVGLLCGAALIISLSVRSAIRRVPRLFQRNAQLKVEGYYMGEFEFKMLASQYYLNEGHYREAYQTLQRIEAEMTDPCGLPKMPARPTAAQQMAFLLERQDPITGAFMDRRYPAFTYFAPTCNAIEALERLSAETGQPLRLKYPLRFLDQIRTPAQLRAYLDSLLYLSETASRLPGPSLYGPGVSELAAFHDLEEAGVYQFSDDWKDALCQWFYETQDPATGFWGARIGTPARWRQRIDVNSTFHILKLVVDEWGTDRDARFPLRHADALALGVLASMDVPLPEDAAEQHDWGLKEAQGARILARFLWPRLPETERQRVRFVFKAQLAQVCRLYRPAEGGFAYYTSEAKADLDGTGLALSTLKDMGILPGTPERDRLWGKELEAAPGPVRATVGQWGQASLPMAAEARSYRVYVDRMPSEAAYDDCDLVQIVYPTGEFGGDLMDIRQGLARFVDTNGQTFGNWTSKASLQEIPMGLNRAIRSVPVVHVSLDLARAAREHPAAQRFYVIGYDAAQVPVVRVEFSLA
jgi:hypothetical protein